MSTHYEVHVLPDGRDAVQVIRYTEINPWGDKYYYPLSKEAARVLNSEIQQLLEKAQNEVQQLLEKACA